MLGGRRRRRGYRYIHGIFSAGTEVGGVPGRRMPDEGEQPRETQRTIHVSELEVEGGGYIEGTGKNANMKSLWDAYVSSVADETQIGRLDVKRRQRYG